MSDVERMQKLLDTVLVRIEELDEKIKEWKAKNSQSNPSAAVELRNLKKALAVQVRIKITLIQSIQELSPSSNTMTIFRAPTFLSKLKGLFRG